MRGSLIVGVCERKRQIDHPKKFEVDVPRQIICIGREMRYRIGRIIGNVAHRHTSIACQCRCLDDLFHILTMCRGSQQKEDHKWDDPGKRFYHADNGNELRDTTRLGLLIFISINNCFFTHILHLHHNIRTQRRGAVILIDSFHCILIGFPGSQLSIGVRGFGGVVV